MENITFQDLLGLNAGILVFCSYCFYIYAIFFKGTKPNRTTWFLLTVISLVITFSYQDLGAGSTLWLALGSLFGTLLVAIASIPYGTNGKLLTEALCILTAIFCLVLYLVIADPFITLMIALVMDGAILLPTIQHAYSSPQEEDATAWGMTVIADLLAIFSLQVWTLEMYLYPLYMFLINGLVLLLIIRHSLFVAVKPRELSAARSNRL